MDLSLLHGPIHSSLVHPQAFVMPQMVSISARLVFLLVLFGIGASCAELSADPAKTKNPSEEAFFESKIRPILVSRCVSCHGAEKQESGLRLDNPKSALEGGVSGARAVVPGDPDHSLMVRAVTRQGDIKMPPETPIPDAEVDALMEWIRRGAYWPDEPTPVAAETASDRIAPHRKNHWAYQRISRPRPPNVKERKWARASLDRFVLAKLEGEGVNHASEAEPRDLIRRAYLDLTGLPPTFDQVEDYVNDKKPLRYERLIDRLLTSPAYGEHAARRWLDVARYADTRGYFFDNDRRYPYAYTYRDYVIRSFNADMPFDRFLLEQLAADLLPTQNDPSTLAALGFLTVGRKFNNMQEDIDDKIDVVTRGLMGVTAACARCHDHKYDAIPTEDYYSLYGVFASSYEPEIDKLPLLRPTETGGDSAFREKLAALQKVLDDFLAAKRKLIQAESVDHAVVYLAKVISNRSTDEIAALPFTTLKPEQVRDKLVDRFRKRLDELAKEGDPTWGFWRDIRELDEARFSELAKPILDKWTQGQEGSRKFYVNHLLQEVLRDGPPLTKVEVASIYGSLLNEAIAKWREGGQTEEAFAKLSGEHHGFLDLIHGGGSPGDFSLDETAKLVNRAERNEMRDIKKKLVAHEAAEPEANPRAMVFFENATPTNPEVLLRGNPNRKGPSVPRRNLALFTGVEREPFHQGSGRLELARSIVAKENPLTRRVLANRVWMWLFGSSLVDSPGDFGIRCEPPVQAELLDYLASRVLESGWSLKELEREIVLSSVYRQSSEVTKESMASDPDNRRLAHANARRLTWEQQRDSILLCADELDTRLFGRSVPIERAPYPRRRTLYAYLDRQDVPGLFRVFDIASPDQTSTARPRTTGPQQALFYMNSPFVIEMAEKLVADLDQDRSELAIERVFKRTLARKPTKEELIEAKEFLDQPKSENDSMTPLTQLAQALIMSNEFSHQR